MTVRANPNGDLPQVDPTAYIDPSAQVIGNVRIGAEVFVGPGAVIRADETNSDGQVQAVEIGDQCNVQDGVIIHALGGTQVKVGQRTSLAHGCIIHGPCTIGEDCFIGFRAVVYKSVLGAGSFINASAVVQGVELTKDSLVAAAAAILSEDDVTNLVGTADSAERSFNERVVEANLELTKGYLGGEQK
jgi:carbonic anhydrase/acetyltransferase-like protein (isoleucine patch superfamily)